MTLQNFLYKWNGKPIDFDHAYGNQCVDLIQQYNKEMYNGPFLKGATALNIWDNMPDIYNKVLNTPTNTPNPGDIIFWSFNHVAIVVAADMTTLTSFDQNYPSQGYVDSNGNFIGTGVCHFQEHTYQDPYGKINCLGWWSKK